MGDASLPPPIDPSSWSVPTSPPAAGWPAAGPPVTPPPPSGAPAPTAPPERPPVDPVEAFVGFAKRRPSWFDLVMIVASALSYVSHGFGVGLSFVMAWWVVWLMIWARWAFVRSGLVGPVVSIATFMLILFGSPSWQLGLELERDCLEKVAAEAIVADALDQPLPSVTNCGLLRWSGIAVRHNAVDIVDPDSDTQRAVYFSDAGTRHWTLFGGNGLVFSPDGEPRCRSVWVGDVHFCELHDLGDGWYYVRAVSNIN